MGEVPAGAVSLFQEIKVDVDDSYIEVQVVHPPRINFIISQLAKAVNQLGTEVASLKERMERTEGSLGSMETEQADMRGIMDTMRGLPEQVAALSTDMIDRTEEIKSLDARVTVVENTHAPDIKPLENAIEELQEKTTTHAKHLHDTDDRIEKMDKSTSLIKSQVCMTSNELSAVTTGLGDLLGVLSIDKKDLKELNTQDNLTSPNGPARCVEYFHGLPVFKGLKETLAQHGEQLRPLEEGMAGLRQDLVEADANARSGLLKLGQKIVTKLEKDEFTTLKQQFFELLDRCAIMEEKGNQTAAALVEKADHTDVNTKVDRLDTVKADRADILNLPSVDDFDNVHNELGKLTERLEQMSLTFDVETREIRQLASARPGSSGAAAARMSQARASLTSLNSISNAGGDARDYDRIRKRLEDYRKWLERLDELKLDRSEFRAVQDWITNLALQSGKEGGLPTVLPTLPTPIPTDAKFENRPRRPSSGGSAGRGAANAAGRSSPANTTGYPTSEPGASPAITPLNAGLGQGRPGSAPGSAQTKHLRRSLAPVDPQHPTDADVHIPAARNRLPLARAGSAGSRHTPSTATMTPAAAAELITVTRGQSADAPCEYEQMTSSVPLKHIPAGLRMGRSTPCMSNEGVATNVMVTPKQDWSLREGPLSPLGIAAAAERGQIVLRQIE